MSTRECFSFYLNLNISRWSRRWTAARNSHQISSWTAKQTDRRNAIQLVAKYKARDCWIAMLMGCSDSAVFSFWLSRQINRLIKAPTKWVSKDESLCDPRHHPWHHRLSSIINIATFINSEGDELLWEEVMRERSFAIRKSSFQANATFMWSLTLHSTTSFAFEGCYLVWVY